MSAAVRGPVWVHDGFGLGNFEPGVLQMCGTRSGQGVTLRAFGEAMRHGAIRAPVPDVPTI
eukprot:7811089-Alexandrium_andersonii.AAC.1